MNPLNYIFDDMRGEKMKLLQHAPRENDVDEKQEAYRGSPSEFDAPLEPLHEIRQKFHGDHASLYDMDFNKENKETYLRRVKTYPDFQLNRSIVKVAMFLPSLAWRNQKTTLSVFLLTAFFVVNAAFPTFDMLAGAFMAIKTFAILAVMLGTLIAAVGVLMFLIYWAEKGFGSLVAMRPGDKVLSLFMPKWDKHRNKMLSP